MNWFTNRTICPSGVARRNAIAGFAALLFCGSARGQSAKKLRHVGILLGGSATDRLAAFRQTLEKLGWIDQQNVRLEIRIGGGDRVRVRTQAEELVASAPDVLVAGGITAAVELAKLTRSIPIVLAYASDPVGSGLAHSLAKPGGNVTGFTNPDLIVPGTYLELLREAVPKITEVFVAFGGNTVPGNRPAIFKAMETDAVKVKLRTIQLPLLEVSAIDQAIASAARSRQAGLVVLTDIFTSTHYPEIVVAAARHRIPAIYGIPVIALEGGLMAYGSDPIEAYRGAADYVNRILKGDSPALLPIQQPVRFDLVVNLKTARTMGISMPPTIMVRATKVIQ